MNTLNKINIVKSKKRRTISIELEQNGSIKLRIPYKATNKDIKDVLDKNKAWILKKQEEQKRNLKLLKSLTFKDGSFAPYLGKEYPIQYNSNISNKLIFNGDYFCLNPSKIDDNNNKEIFIKWYKKQARSIISDRTIYYSENNKLKYNRIRLSGAKTRWGSCSSKKNLNFSWRLILAPLDVIDYVVVHELAHTKEMNHQKGFWNMVEEMFPTYKSQRLWLKKNAHRLLIN